MPKFLERNRATHGTKVMNEKQIKNDYGETKKWEPLEDFLNQKPSQFLLGLLVSKHISF